MSRVYDEAAGTWDECLTCGHREQMTGSGADAVYGCTAEEWTCPLDKWAEAAIAAALDRVAENGGIHRHSPSCIHNLTPEEQVGLRGYTLDEWVARYGQLPEQITPEQWELPAIEIPPHPSEWSER